MKDEDYTKVADLDELLKKEPNNVNILLEKGRILYNKMADERAVEVFRNAIEIDPQCVDAYLGLAECLKWHLGEDEEAEVVVLQGLEIDPQRKELMELLVAIREDLAEWKLMIQKLKKQ